jgi:prepilin-type N-terminal cleavage/methylation domain-containing protein
MRNKRASCGRGFTFVEVMVVVLILGMLVAVGTPAFITAREKSYATSCRYNLKQIMGAKERWAMDNDKGPDSIPLMVELELPGVYVQGNPRCPGGGDYEPRRLDQLPTCTIGGIPGELDAHVLP